MPLLPRVGLISANSSPGRPIGVKAKAKKKKRKEVAREMSAKSNI